MKCGVLVLIEWEARWRGSLSTDGGLRSDAIDHLEANMALQSLITEITGVIPLSEAATDVAPGRRLLVVFEDGSPTLRDWQNDLMWIDRDQLRLLNVSVVSIPVDGENALLDGAHATLPTDKLRAELQGKPEDQRPSIVLLSSDGKVLLRSDHAVTIQQLGDAIKTLDRGNGWA